jgi:hypothetical protein
MSTTISPTSNVMYNLLYYPRQFFQKIIHQPKDKYFTILFILSNIAVAFSAVKQQEIETTKDLASLVLKPLLNGLLFGWIFTYLYAAMISSLGNWMTGKASAKKIVRVIVYASIPSMIALGILAIKVAMFGKAGLGMFDGRLPLSSGQSAVWISLGIMQSLLGLWSCIALVIGISEAQQFSIGKAILNVLLPTILIMVLVGMALLFSTTVIK